jgi:glyoxylase-like metal-dependent hydrolase (beta-lactamase superfamily II)
VPVYATQSTIDGMRATAQAKRAEWKPTYGADYPDATCFPDFVLPRSGRVTVDGLDLRVRDYGPGEASTESLVLAPSLRAAFVGDLIYTDVHPWLAEGRSRLRLGQLDRLRSEVPATWTVYPGHGPSGSPAVIGAERSYLTDFRTATRRSMTADGLSQQATHRLIDRFRARDPGWSLEMLLPLNAAAVARELAAGGAP